MLEMHRVDELPPATRERQLEGFYRMKAFVPDVIIGNDNLVTINIERYMRYPGHLIWKVASGEYTANLIGNTTNEFKMHGLVEFEISRKTVEELENDA